MIKYIPILFLLFSHNVLAAGFCESYENVNTDVISYPAAGDPSYPAGGNPDLLDDCEFAPDGYEIIIYEFGMCTQAPAAPTGASAADTTTNCEVIYQSDAGEAFNLAVGASFNMQGAEKPANGTYTYGYVIMANTFGITLSQEFGNVMEGIGAGSGQGNFCYSSANTVDGSTGYHVSNSGTLASGPEDYVTCGASAGQAIKITETLDVFGCNGPAAVPGNCEFTASAPTSDGQMTAYLVNQASASGALVSDNFLSNPLLAADRLIGFLQWTTPVIITDSTSEADMQFSVNNGTSPQLFPPSSGADYDIFSFGSGPFSVNIAVQ